MPVVKKMIARLPGFVAPDVSRVVRGSRSATAHPHFDIEDIENEGI
jgi:hypothetical protein